MQELGRGLDKSLSGQLTQRSTKGFVVEIVGNEVIGDGQQDGRLGAGPAGNPHIALGGRIRQARVEGNDFGTLALGFDDALGMGVEVVAALEMGADQHDGPGVGVVRARPVGTGPEMVAGAGGGTADVGVAVVPVDAPALDGAVGKMVLARAAHVVHDAVAPLGPAARAFLLGNLVEGLVPARCASTCLRRACRRA